MYGLTDYKNAGDYEGLIVICRHDYNFVEIIELVRDTRKVKNLFVSFEFSLAPEAFSESKVINSTGTHWR